MEKILGLIKENKKTVIAIVVVILGYFGYDSVAEQLGLSEATQTEVVADSANVSVDSATVVVDTTSAN